MSKDFDRILDESIDRLIQGGSLEECLANYPEFAGDLEPLLVAYDKLSTKDVFVPSSSAKAKERARIHQRFAELRQKRFEQGSPLFQRVFGKPKLWVPVASVILLVLIGYALVTVLDTSDTAPEVAIATPTPTSVATTPVSSPTASPDVPPATIPAISPTAIPATSTPTPAPIPTISPTAPPATTPAASPTAVPATPAPTPAPTYEPTPTIVADVGILDILVTDAPAYDISAVDLTIANIEVHLGIEDEERDDVDEDGWEMVIEGSRSFELLALRGVEAFLGSKELEIGHYTGIRMDVEEVIVTVDGGTRSATVPSDKLKLVRSFDIEAGKTTALTLDFDAEESVIITGNGKVNFKPTVRIIVVQDD